MSARLAAALLLGLLSSCYNYRPLTALDPEPGTRVAAELTDSGTVALARYLGPDVAALDGRLLTITDQELGLSVVSVRDRRGIEHYWKGETVILPRGDVATLRQRKLALGRSVAISVAGVGASLALLRAFGVYGTGSGGTGRPPGGQ